MVIIRKYSWATTLLLVYLSGYYFLYPLGGINLIADRNIFLKQEDPYFSNPGKTTNIAALLYFPILSTQTNQFIGEWGDGKTTVKLGKDGTFSISSKKFSGTAKTDFHFYNHHYLCIVCEIEDAIYDIIVKPVYMNPKKIQVFVDGGFREFSSELSNLGH